MNIAVLIRVYNRIEDLNYNIQVIKDLWKENNYDLYICFNGKEHGYKLDKNIYDASQVIELEKNSGHLKGNSQLLIEGMEHISTQNYDYIIILEADTWIMGDQLISKYIQKMNRDNILWASAEWVENRHSVGLDFAIIHADTLNHHYKQLFDFSINAEMWVAQYLITHKIPYIFISELMPVHRPSIVKSFYNADGGRLRVFPQAKMVTHHIENLKGGIDKKKELADTVFRNNYFTTKSVLSITKEHFLYLSTSFILKYLPRSSWVKKKKFTHFE